MSVKTMLMDYSAQVEKALEEYLPQKDCLQAELLEAMRYSVLGGGKRIRPALALEFCRILGGRSEDAMPFGCAVEMVHGYSLIHDDLPCMDNDDMRRGKPSTHKQFGEAMALLAGDALLSLAFETLLRSGANAESRIAASAELARASGCMGMVGGQVIDLQCENRTVGIETLREMHAGKTGAMIIAAARMGCYAANADAAALESATEYARGIGLAFQITDDILDVVSDAAVLGKSVGKDSRDHKSTYVTIYGIEKSRALAKEATEQAVAALEPFGKTADPLRELAQFLLERNK